MGEIISTFYKIFQKIDKGTLPQLYEASITLKLKPYKHITRKLQTIVPHEYRCKHLQQNINKLSPETCKHIHHDQMGFILVMQGCFKIQIHAI